MLNVIEILCTDYDTAYLGFVKLNCHLAEIDHEIHFRRREVQVWPGIHAKLCTCWDGTQNCRTAGGKKKKKELFIVVVSYDNVRRLHGGFFIHATKVSQTLAFVWIFTEYIQVWRSMLRHDMPGKIKCTGRDAKELTARRRSELQKKNVEIINLLLLQSREKYVPVSIVVSSVWMCHCSVCLS